MTLKKIIISCALGALLIVTSYFIYKKKFTKKQTPLFKTEQPENRSIAQTVFATGTLEIKNVMKIGSVISGIVDKLYVKENQFVKKGEVIATVDPGTGTTDYEQARLRLEQEQNDLTYLEANFLRNQELFNARQQAQDLFDRIKKDYENKKLSLNIAKELLERESLLLEKRKLKAVGDGYITAIRVSKGTSVTGANVSSAEPLFEIAPDIARMKASLDIDESDIGFIKPTQQVNISVSSYPDKTIKSFIKNISFSPKKESGGSLFYKAKIKIDNDNKLLRPGMSINAKIKVAKCKNALVIKGVAFQINPELINTVAQRLHLTSSPLSKKEKQNFIKKNHNERAKTVWTKNDSGFVEKIILIGVTDNNYFEIKSGLNEEDNVVIDIIEPDDMEKMYKKWFSGPL